MVKLKRINEGQLNLFDWKPKEIDPPKPTASKEPDSYGGRTDTDQSKWFTQSFLNKKYDEYNRRFFNNSLPDIPVKTGRKSHGGTIGYCKLRGNRFTNSVWPNEIIISNKDYKNRFNMEDTLVHEMCHVYQIAILCDGKFDVYTADCKRGSGSSGHGPLFFKAADMVNNSPDNIEGFKVTQYDESGEIKNQAYTKADGWLILSPHLSFISTRIISDTPNGRSNLKKYNPVCAFTYKDADIKTKYVDRLGIRGDKNYLYTLSWLKDAINDIKNGNLIPVRMPEHKKYLFIGKSKESEGYSFIATSDSSKKSLYTDITEVNMNSPYDILQDLIGESSIYLTSNSFYNTYSDLKNAIQAGVYDIDSDFLDSLVRPHSESIRRKRKVVEKVGEEDVIEELEKIGNVVEIEEITEDVFEITIC